MVRSIESLEARNDKHTSNLLVIVTAIGCNKEKKKYRDRISKHAAMEEGSIKMQLATASDGSKLSTSLHG